MVDALGTDLTADEVDRMPAHVRIVYYATADHPELRQDVSGAVRVILLGRLALAYADELRFEEAIVTGERALRILDDDAVDDDALRGRVLMTLADAYDNAGDAEKAVSTSLEGWTYARRTDDEELILTAGEIVLEVLTGRPTGEPELAFLTEYLPFVEAAGYLDERARARRLLGEGQLGRGRLADAVGNLDKALTTSAALPGTRVFRREVVRLLETAELDGIEVPPPGPGVLREAQDLVDDGITSRDRGMTERAETCFRRAATLLSRHGTEAQRHLAARLATLDTDAPDLEELRALAHGVAEGRR